MEINFPKSAPKPAFFDDFNILWITIYISMFLNRENFF